MNILAFCSALDKTYLAIKYNEKIYDEIIKTDENYHSLYLISKIKSVFDDNSLDLKNIDLITVNSGPGSFTGIRAALSIAKVMSSELNKPLVCLNTAEILLNVYDYNKLVMDARRDMFFIGTKENIQIVLKENIKEKISKNDKILTDKNSFAMFDNAFCYEDGEKNTALTMLNLAEEKFTQSKDKSEFSHTKAQANYIQTPPVF